MGEAIGHIVSSRLVAITVKPRLGIGDVMRITVLLIGALVVAACSDPDASTPHAQFTGGVDDAGETAVLVDATMADDVTADVLADAEDAPFLADVPVAVDVADIAPAEDVPVQPDVTLPPDVMTVADIQPDVTLPPDVIMLADIQLSVCGDGLCTPGLENAANCPSDCAPPTWTACAALPCGAVLAACKGNGGCAGVLTCASACAGASCVQACATPLGYNTLANTLKPVVTCAINAGCLGGFDPGPGGGPNSCGNGVCDGGETHLTCPKDCGFPISANEQCQVQSCASSYAACAGDKACVAAATCYNQYGNVLGCAGSNQAAGELNALIQCIYSQCP